MTIHQQNRIKRVCVICCLLVTQTVWGTPFENYINRTEPDYRWQPTKVLNEPWGEIGHYELASQNWRGHGWTHHLVIVRPLSIRNPDIAFLRIAGDGNGENQIDSLKILARVGLVSSDDGGLLARIRLTGYGLRVTLFNMEITQKCIKYNSLIFKETHLKKDIFKIS